MNMNDAYIGQLVVDVRGGYWYGWIFRIESLREGMEFNVLLAVEKCGSWSFKSMLPTPSGKVWGDISGLKPAPFSEIAMLTREKECHKF